VRPKQLRLFERPEPGDSVQVDVKVVKVSGRKAFQYTAIDDCTRFRVLRLYREQNQRSSIDFLAELRRALPFPIRRLQCDNGSEFPLAFALTVEAAGISYQHQSFIADLSRGLIVTFRTRTSLADCCLVARANLPIHELLADVADAASSISSG
jgi:integrase-like protein